jgi:hypothetical protein
MKACSHVAGAILAATLVFLMTGCSEQAPRADAPSASPPTTGGEAAATREQTANTGVIEAQVIYAGTPVSETIRVNKDVEQCGTEARNQKILVAEGGGLAYAVVSVAGLEGPTTARAPQIDQRACQFQPRVVAMQAGEIEIL